MLTELLGPTAWKGSGDNLAGYGSYKQRNNDDAERSESGTSWSIYDSTREQPHGAAKTQWTTLPGRHIHRPPEILAGYISIKGYASRSGTERA